MTVAEALDFLPPETVARPFRVTPVWLRPSVLTLVLAAHAMTLVGFSFYRPTIPPALETIDLTMVAEGEPVPEKVEEVKAQEETEPEPHVEEIVPPVIEAPPPPVKVVEQALEIPVEKPKPVLPPKPQHKPKRDVKPAPERTEPRLAQRAERVGLAEGKAQDTGMSQATYGALILAQIRANRFYPDAARAQGLKGATRVAFSVGSSGSMTSVTVVGSSGSSILDDAARQIVRSVHVPSPPGGSFSGSTTVNFSLH